MIRTASAALFVLAATLAPAMADDLADKLCPLLAETSTLEDPAVIQMNLVFGLAGAYENPEDLAAIPDRADDVATAACPEDREATLKRAEATSLFNLLR